MNKMSRKGQDSISTKYGCELENVTIGSHLDTTKRKEHSGGKIRDGSYNIHSLMLADKVLLCPDCMYEVFLFCRTERDKAPPSPYLTINSSGTVLVHNDQVLVSTCMMQVYKFPFDVQSCTLSIKSVVHSGKSALSCSSIFQLCLYFL